MLSSRSLVPASGQSSDARLASECFVERQNLVHSSREGYFCDEVIREACRVFPSCINGFPDEIGGFDLDALRLKDSV